MATARERFWKAYEWLGLVRDAWDILTLFFAATTVSALLAYIAQSTAWLGQQPAVLQVFIGLTLFLFVLFLFAQLRSSWRETHRKRTNLERLSVLIDGFPQLIRGAGTKGVKFIVLPHITVASPTTISVDFGLRLNAGTNRDIEYAVSGEPLPQWETVKQFELVEHIQPLLSCPLNLESGKSASGYLAFRFVRSEMDAICQSPSHRRTSLRVRDLHTRQERMVSVGTIDVRDLAG